MEPFLEFTMARDAINADALRTRLADPRAGASVVFEGWVRNHADGRPVLALDYEAFDALSEKEGRRVLAEAAAKFALLRLVAVHRTGALQIGDLAVWVGVAAAHRGDAFGGCRFVIDELKARLPIWKREHYADGATEWVNAVTR
ncbi:molybdenum cofactor biosynthesis protein MoaE [Nibricoccus sp. IMCC34717]|uniref:molybdenum cofactor biosynthesis protein MoaE n=1 Tax=Nibricoccus sp. IMCC34717 TaxID=3034021 RepID=UPI00384D113C